MIINRSLLAALLATVLALPHAPALAEVNPPFGGGGGGGMNTNASNATLPTARQNLGVSATTALALGDYASGGAYCNTIVSETDGAITSGLTAFVSTAITFTAADIGKSIVIAGAGAGSPAAPLVTVIDSITGAHQANLHVAAGATVTAAAAWYYGTDDLATFNAAITAATATSNTNTNPAGTAIAIPGKNCATSAVITLPPGVSLAGQGKFSTAIWALGSMTEVVQRNGTFGYGGGLQHLTIDAFRLASYGLYVPTGTEQLFDDIAVRDGTVNDIRYGDGTGAAYQNTWRNVEGSTSGGWFPNVSQMAANSLYVNGPTDSIFLMPTQSQSTNANILDAGSNNHYIHPHTFGTGADNTWYPVYGIECSAGPCIITGAQIDNASQAGIFVSANDVVVVGSKCGWASGAANTLNCIEVASAKDYLTITGNTSNALVASKMIVLDGTPGTHSTIVGNGNATNYLQGTDSAPQLLATGTTKGVRLSTDANQGIVDAINNTNSAVVKLLVSGHPLVLADNSATKLDYGATTANVWTWGADIGGGLPLRDTSAAFNVNIGATSSTTLTGNVAMTLDMKNVAHTLALNATANTITFPNTASYTLIGSGDANTVTNAILAQAATNTVKGNATSGTANETDLAVASCSAAGNALKWTTNTGFGCNTAITAAAMPASGLTGTTMAASVVTSSLTTVASGATATDQINQEFEVSSATLTKTSDTALAVVTGLTQTLTAGKTYHCRGHLTGTANASGGIKVALVAPSTLTATSTTWTGFTWNGTTAVSNTTVTALGSNIAAATAVYSDIYIDGSIVVNAAGPINVQAAQNASFATSTTVLQGSTFSCVRVN